MRKILAILFLWPGFVAAARAAITLDLSVTGTASLPPDGIDAVLTATGTGPTAAAAQTRVNGMMKAALQAARATAGVTATTADYNVAPIYPKNISWRAQQSLSLSQDAAPGSEAAKPMLALIGTLQSNGLMLQNLSGTLTPKAERQATNAAIGDAVRRLKAQADIVAAALGDQVGGIIGLSLNVNQRVLPLLLAPMARATAPSISAAPVSEEVSLSGKVSLTPRNR